MRDPARIKRILDKIETLWTVIPDQRLGQFYLNVTSGSKGNMYNLEDSDFEAFLDDWISINFLEGRSGWKS